MDEKDTVARLEAAAKNVRSGGSPEKTLSDLSRSPEAEEEFCRSVGTEKFLLDVWVAGKDPDRVAEALEACARKARAREEKSGIPDGLVKLIEGKLERGVIHMPTELLRDLFAVGLTVSRIRRGKAKAAEVEDVAKRLIDRAANWADGVRDGVKNDGAVVPVRPEDVPF